MRFLVGRSTDVTVVLLSGTSLRFVGEATELARALQPAVVVLEDVDLVALDRNLHEGPQPPLFTVMEAMDGLEGDSDIAFVLTTNRADLLEPALAQRPGRVDLAVEIPLPDLPQRRRLAALCSRSLAGFSEAALDAVADLTHALDELLDEGHRLTRSLLGSGSPVPAGTGRRRARARCRAGAASGPGPGSPPADRPRRGQPVG